MGGYSSGRYRTRNRGTIDAAKRLDIRSFRKWGVLKEGALVTGTTRWSWGGEEIGSAAYRVDFRWPERRRIWLSFSMDGQGYDLPVEVEAVPMRFGGLRYYFRCPATGRRCEVLALIGGRLACRQHFRLAYASQSDDAFGKLHRRIARLEQALSRPRRNPRRARLHDRYHAATFALDNLFSDVIARRFRGVPH